MRTLNTIEQGAVNGAGSFDDGHEVDIAIRAACCVAGRMFAYSMGYPDGLIMGYNPSKILTAGDFMTDFAKAYTAGEIGYHTGKFLREFLSENGNSFDV